MKAGMEKGVKWKEGGRRLALGRHLLAQTCESTALAINYGQLGIGPMLQKGGPVQGSPPQYMPGKGLTGGPQRAEKEGGTRVSSGLRAVFLDDLPLHERVT
jgi:hypothetical protein